MHVEKLKYIIWAKEIDRAIQFYAKVFDATIVRQSEVMAELSVAGALIGIHSGGEGKRTWTGMSFQISDLFEGCRLLTAEGGLVKRFFSSSPQTFSLTSSIGESCHRHGDRH